MNWIPCSERLPDEEGRYLVTVEYGVKKDRMVQRAVLKVFDNGKKKWFRTSRNDNVVAWMELPEPYRGE